MFRPYRQKHCTYQAARRWRRDEGASVSYGSGVSRRRVLSWRGCCGEMLLGAKTRRATSDWVAHYRRGVFRSLSVPNVFYSDGLSFRPGNRILLHIFGRVTNV